MTQRYWIIDPRYSTTEDNDHALKEGGRRDATATKVGGIDRPSKWETPMVQVTEGELKEYFGKQPFLQHQFGDFDNYLNYQNEYTQAYNNYVGDKWGWQDVPEEIKELQKQGSEGFWDTTTEDGLQNYTDYLNKIEQISGTDRTWTPEEAQMNLVSGHVANAATSVGSYIGDIKIPGFTLPDGTVIEPGSVGIGGGAQQNYGTGSEEYKNSHWAARTGMDIYNNFQNSPEMQALNEKYGIDPNATYRVIGDDGNIWSVNWNGTGFESYQFQDIPNTMRTGDYIKAAAVTGLALGLGAAGGQLLSGTGGATGGAGGATSGAAGGAAGGSAGNIAAGLNIPGYTGAGSGLGGLGGAGATGTGIGVGSWTGSGALGGLGGAGSTGIGLGGAAAGGGLSTLGQWSGYLSQAGNYANIGGALTGNEDLQKFGRIASGLGGLGGFVDTGWSNIGNTWSDIGTGDTGVIPGLGDIGTELGQGIGSIGQLTGNEDLLKYGRGLGTIGDLSGLAGEGWDSISDRIKDIGGEGVSWEDTLGNIWDVVEETAPYLGQIGALTGNKDLQRIAIGIGGISGVEDLYKQWKDGELGFDDLPDALKAGLQLAVGAGVDPKYLTAGELTGFLGGGGLPSTYPGLGGGQLPGFGGGQFPGGGYAAPSGFGGFQNIAQLYEAITGQSAKERIELVRKQVPEVADLTDNQLLGFALQEAAATDPRIAQAIDQHYLAAQQGSGALGTGLDTLTGIATGSDPYTQRLASQAASASDLGASGAGVLGSARAQRASQTAAADVIAGRQQAAAESLASRGQGLLGQAGIGYGLGTQAAGDLYNVGAQQRAYQQQLLDYIARQNQAQVAAGQFEQSLAARLAGLPYQSPTGQSPWGQGTLAGDYGQGSTGLTPEQLAALLQGNTSGGQTGLTEEQIRQLLGIPDNMDWTNPNAPLDPDASGGIPENIDPTPVPDAGGVPLNIPDYGLTPEQMQAIMEKYGTPGYATGGRVHRGGSQNFNELLGKMSGNGLFNKNPKQYSGRPDFNQFIEQLNSKRMQEQIKKRGGPGSEELLNKLKQRDKGIWGRHDGLLDRQQQKPAFPTKQAPIPQDPMPQPQVPQVPQVSQPVSTGYNIPDFTNPNWSQGFNFNNPAIYQSPLTGADPRKVKTYNQYLEDRYGMKPEDIPMQQPQNNRRDFSGVLPPNFNPLLKTFLPQGV